MPRAGGYAIADSSEMVRVAQARCLLTRLQLMQTLGILLFEIIYQDSWLLCKLKV
ncbi:hypothetical protein [Nostoc sp. CCY 9925]|uniref:hypothetical protein n=1 Tax=Nostoc sp. CCY 9925 TaxID=3103865 RepID=UPI0039C5FF3F